MSDPPPMPSPYDFVTYRDFFVAWLDEKHRRKAGYTSSMFARLAGMSPSHVRNVVHGQRTMVSPYLDGANKAMGLDRPAARYACCLATLAVSRSAHHRYLVLREMAALAAQHGSHLHPSLQPMVLMEPTNTLVLELANTPGFRAHAPTVAEVLSLPVERIEGAFRELRAAGYLVVEADGRARPAQMDLTLPSELVGPVQIRFQQRMMDLFLGGHLNPGQLTLATAMPLAEGDAGELERVVLGLYHRMYKAMERLAARVDEHAGALAVFGFQAASLPISGPLPLRVQPT